MFVLGLVSKQEIKRETFETVDIYGKGSILWFLTQDAWLPNESVPRGTGGGASGVPILRDSRWEVRVWIWPAVPP